MKKVLFIIPILLLIFGIRWYSKSNDTEIINGAPPYGVPEEEAPDSLDPYGYLRSWQRPEGPAKVALQVGHLDNKNFPDELSKLRGNTGASGGGTTEVEVNQTIASLTKTYLEDVGVNVEILPATVPPKYWADVFVAIHADGSTDPATTGYKFAGPWRDFTNNSDKLVAILNKEYEKATGLVYDPNISRNMRGYYAFAWWRYEHAIHPMTTAVIAETGFLSNASDRKIIVDQPEISARAIADGIIIHLKQQGLI